MTRTLLIYCLKVSAANVWCAKYRPKALKLRVLTGVHSPDQFRVQGPFSNMEDFSRDFNCPIGSNMNPPKENKCQVNFHVFSSSVQNIAGVVTHWCRKRLLSQSEKNPSNRNSNLPDQTTSSQHQLSYFLHYDDMKAFIMFLWSKTIFLQRVDILTMKC